MKKYIVTGMTCSACAARVEQAVSKLPDVESCSVSLLTNTLLVEGSVKDQQILKAVKDAGYQGKLPDAANRDVIEEVKLSRLIARFLLSAVLSGLLMMASPLWQFLLATIVLLLHWRLFASGTRGIIHRSMNMDTLVSLGSGVSYLYSAVLFFSQSKSHLYFASAAMILTFITFGKTLETYSKGKTTTALQSLIAMKPKTATLLRDGKEIEVPIEQVQVSDIFVVRPGENIPVDGIIVEGSSAVNESFLTGESIPVDKHIQDEVSAATTNLSGYLRCEATRVGEDTTLSQIIHLVFDAAATKAPIAKIADRVSAVFVPVVIALSLLTLLVWAILGKDWGFVLSKAIAVLVISCPCALGLATPVAIMVGNGMGARKGILFKNAPTLENAGHIDIVALDKTGTVTSGQPTVTGVYPQAGVTLEELLSVAVLLESRSEHPLAKAILSYAQDLLVSGEVEEFEVLPGNGIRAQYQGCCLVAGSVNFLSNGFEISEELLDKAKKLASQGNTPILFARDKDLLGMVTIADTIKEDSASAIQELKQMGLQVVMITGDNKETASYIAEQAGIDTVYAQVSPDMKEQYIKELQKQGRVAMVGDGINDAPALTRADIGIAIGAGTDIAIEAADIVLMKNSLADVAAAIRLSRATLLNIHENLFWAFFYNMVGIPLAAGVFYPVWGWELSPMFASAAMGLSSFCVTLNALRLNLYHIYDSRWDKKYLKKRKKKSTMKKTMKIEGMMCTHCSKRVTDVLEAMDGVEAAKVSHETGTAELVLSKEVGNAQLVKAVTDAGYVVKDIM